MKQPNLNKPAFDLFPTAKKAIENNKCPICGQEIKDDDFKDRLSKKEYGISGLCQKCQDATFGG